MPEFTPRQLALYGLSLLAFIVLAAWYLARGDGAAATPSRPAAAIQVQGADDRASALTIHVAGAVRRPGVYRMRAGARVDDAVTRAGGPRRRADLSALNLAAKLEDGRQVLVPRVAPAAGGAPTTTGAATGAAAAGAAAVPLNLNTATPEQLDELDGIGPATAQQIIAYREAHGGFGTVDLRRRTM